MPAIISKNLNTAGSGLTKGTAYDSGNIKIVAKAGVGPIKQVDGTQQSATTLACDAVTAPGNFLAGSGQNNTGSPAPITAVSYSGSTLTVTCANNFSVGMNVELLRLVTNTALNLMNFVVATASSTQFTATKAGLTVTNGADTGTATYANATRGAGLSLYAGHE